MHWLRKQNESDPQERPRATRFAIASPLEYRTVSDSDWHSGMIENVSCTGVLFRAKSSLDVHTPIALKFALPAALSGPLPVQVMCAGRVVRQAAGGAAPALAVAVSDCYLSESPTRSPQRSATVAMADGLEVWRFVHDLNNQLAVIVGHCDLVLNQIEVSQNVRDAVEQIKATALQTASAARYVTPGPQR